MGSGAFLMVAFTEQKYIAIVIAAVIPALLYYWGCAVAVMTQTEIAHVTLMDPKDIPKSREVMKDGWIYLLHHRGPALLPARRAVFSALLRPVGDLRGARGHALR